MRVTHDCVFFSSSGVFGTRYGSFSISSPFNLSVVRVKIDRVVIRTLGGVESCDQCENGLNQSKNVCSCVILIE